MKCIKCVDGKLPDGTSCDECHGAGTFEHAATVRVWKVYEGREPTGCCLIVESIAEAADVLGDGDGGEFLIVAERMTRSEINALPDFDGF